MKLQLIDCGERLRAAAALVRLGVRVLGVDVVLEHAPPFKAFVAARVGTRMFLGCITPTMLR